MYLGNNARELRTRLVEHKSHIARPPWNEPRYWDQLRDLALAMHALDTDHETNLDTVEIVRGVL